MSDLTLANTSANDAGEIPCMLLPLTDMSLIVPTVTIAEMSPMRPITEVVNTPPWFLGFYEWRDQKVPVMQFEMLQGGSHRVGINAGGRIAVLNGTGVSKALPFIAVVTQGIPRMARIIEPDISPHEGGTRDRCVVMSVKVGMEEFWIPDIAALESRYIGLNL